MRKTLALLCALLIAAFIGAPAAVADSYTVDLQVNFWQGGGQWDDPGLYWIHATPDVDVREVIAVVCSNHQSPRFSDGLFRTMHICVYTRHTTHNYSSVGNVYTVDEEKMSWSLVPSSGAAHPDNTGDWVGFYMDWSGHDGGSYFAYTYSCFATCPQSYNSAWHQGGSTSVDYAGGGTQCHPKQFVHIGTNSWQLLNGQSSITQKNDPFSGWVSQGCYGG